MSTKNGWNSFLTKHSNFFSFSYAVASKGPPTQTKKGLKLPTPAKLLEDWCRQNLVGDWSSISVARKGIRYVKLAVVEKSDAKRLVDRFTASKQTNLPLKSKNLELGYSDRKYRDLALELGYDV
jgi:hypothetical protein